MFAIGYSDGHFAGEAGQLAGAGIWYDGDGQLRGTTSHGATVLEDEAAAMTIELSGNAPDGHLAGRALDVRAGGQHLTSAGSFEIAMDCLSMVILARVASSNLPSGVWGFSSTSNVPLACAGMAVPFWTGFGADECDCVYAAKPRDRQMTVMAPNPARNRAFILTPLCPRGLPWPAVEERTTTKSERRRGLLGLSYAGRRHAN